MTKTAPKYKATKTPPRYKVGDLVYLEYYVSYGTGQEKMLCVVEDVSEFKDFLCIDYWYYKVAYLEKDIDCHARGHCFEDEMSPA